MFQRLPLFRQFFLFGMIAVPMMVPFAHAESTSEPRNAQSNSGQPLLEVQVVGVSGALKNNIEAYLQQQPRTVAERAAFLFSMNDKVQAAMQALGYFDGKIEPHLDNDRTPWQLTLNITAGTPVRYSEVSVQLDGAASEDRAFTRLIRDSGIQVGDVVDQGKYEDLKSGLTNLGVTRGYFDGELTRHRLQVDRREHQAQLLLSYDSKERFSFGEVTFSGSTLEPRLLQSMVPFYVNEPYDSSKVSEFNTSLQSTGYFSEVKVLPQPQDSEYGQVPMKVELIPAPKHSFSVGAGWSTDTEERLSFTWRTPQINRWGHSQETRLELSQLNPELATSYFIPLGDPLADQLQLEGSLGKDTFGALESTLQQITIGRQTIIDNSWTRRYYVRYLNESWTEVGNEEHADYLIPGISFGKTERKGPSLDPHTGFRQYYNLEYGTGVNGKSENTTRFRGSFRWVETPIQRHRLVSRLDVGANIIADDEVSRLAPSLRFFAGGDQTVRGFDYQSLAPTSTENGITQIVGGRYMIAASLEYQYYFVPRSWRVALFTDIGDAFDTFKKGDGALEWAQSVGTGIHWISPIGPVRFDIAAAISETNTPIKLHITIGAEL